MNPKTTFALLGILVGVVAAWMLFFKDAPPSTADGDDAGDKNVLLPATFDASGLETITIAWADGETATLSRNGRGQWAQVEPVRFPLTDVRIQLGVAGLADKLAYIQSFTPGEEDKPTLEQTGLAKPHVTITFAGKKRPATLKPNEPVSGEPYKHTLKLGDETAGSRGYVQLDDDPKVYVVGAELHKVLLNERPALWRARTLQPPRIEAVRRIRVEHKQAEIDIINEQGDFTFVGKHHGRVSGDAVKALLQAVSKVRIGRFVEDQPKDHAEYGLDEPITLVAIEAETTPRQFELRIGDTAEFGQMYHAVWQAGEQISPVVFTVTKDSNGRFAVLPDDLRDPRITVLQPSQVRELTVQRSDAPGFQLEKTPAGGWTFAKDSETDFTPDSEEVDHLLHAITEATAAQYVANAPVPQQYLARVVLATREAGRADTLLLYEGSPLETAEGEPRESIMVLRNNESTGYLVPADKLAAVFRPAVDLRSHDILTLGPQDLREVRLEREDGVTYVFRENPDRRDPAGRPRWMLVDHEQFEERQFIELLRNFVPLRAGQWLEGEPQLGDQTVKLTLVPKEEGAEPRVLTVDVSNREARMTGVDAPFRVMPVTLAALTAEYRDRTVFDATMRQLDVVQYTESGRLTRFKRDELGRFAVVDASGKRVPGFEVNQQVAAALFDALAPLRVDRFVDQPDDVKPGDAERVIRTRTDTLKQLELRFAFPNHPTLATNGERWFTLTDDTLYKLVGKATAQQSNGPTQR